MDEFEGYRDDLDSYQQYDDFGQEYSREDPKWYGVPAKGDVPAKSKWGYTFQIIAIIALEILIWAVYRYTTAPWFESFGTEQFYLAHIIAAPTIHLLPIVLYWKFFRKERTTHPFVFSKKFLLTGIMLGLVAAFIWRVVEMLVGNGLTAMAGGTQSGTFTVFSMLSETTPALFALMTFVMFFVVGPVEELEFRAFAYDQSARVLSNWGAVILSSVLFGLSHVPIAIFVYQMTPLQLFAAEISWITAGATFGALFMYSRNIFACIVMHGMGNWILSVFWITSWPAGMSEGAAAGTEIATAFISNGIMIVLFWWINRNYWEPHRRGEPALGGRFLNLQERLYAHDFEKRPIVRTLGIAVVFAVLFMGSILGAVAFGAESDLTPLYAGVAVTGKDSSYDFDELVEIPEIVNATGSMAEGASEMIGFDSSENKYIAEVNVKLTWTDEEDIQRVRTFENQPDTFRVTISGPGNNTKTGASENPKGGQGTVMQSLTFNKSEIEAMVDEGDDDYNVTVLIEMVTAGSFQATTGPGLIGFTDTGNDYSYEIEVVWLTTPEEEEDD